MLRDTEKVRPTPFVYTHRQMLHLLGLTESGYQKVSHIIAPHMRRYHSGLWNADDVESLAHRLRYYKTGRDTRALRCRFPPDVLGDIYDTGRRLGVPSAVLVRLLAYEGLEANRCKTPLPDPRWKAFFLRVPRRLSDLSRMVSGEDIAARAVAKMALVGYTAHGLASDADIAGRLDAHPLAILAWSYADVMTLPDPPPGVRLPLDTPLPIPPVYSIKQVSQILGVHHANMHRAGLYPSNIPWVRRYPLTSNGRCVYDADDIHILKNMVERHRDSSGRLNWGDLVKQVQRYRPGDKAALGIAGYFGEAK